MYRRTQSLRPVMTAMRSEGEGKRPAARVLDVAARLSDLHGRTAALLARADAATGHERDVGQERSWTAGHSGEAAALRLALEDVVNELEGLHVAMRTRGIIEQAKGMVMLKNGCDEERAFGTLVRLSQSSHRKLVDVARLMVSSWSRS